MRIDHQQHLEYVISEENGTKMNKIKCEQHCENYGIYLTSQLTTRRIASQLRNHKLRKVVKGEKG